jgi:large subunit ribosomal protein L22
MSKPKAPRRVGDNEALSVGTQIRGSAQKLNLVAALIRNQKAEDALNILSFSKKAMAVDAKKVLASAIANAENNHNLDVDSLVVVEASVGKSITLSHPWPWQVHPHPEALQPSAHRGARSSGGLIHGS